jgi:FixJ family two-component response regulator
VGVFVPEPTLISIIDDDDSLCTALSGLLRSFGYEARSFPSAEVFLAWEGAGGGCDCVITDIHMPGMSGIDLKQVLVARQRAVPVIMITARMDPAVEARAWASGAVCVLKKPFPIDALIECVSKAVAADPPA